MICCTRWKIIFKANCHNRDHQSREQNAKGSWSSLLEWWELTLFLGILRLSIIQWQPSPRSDKEKTATITQTIWEQPFKRRDHCLLSHGHSWEKGKILLFYLPGAPHNKQLWIQLKRKIWDARNWCATIPWFSEVCEPVSLKLNLNTF